MTDTEPYTLTTDEVQNFRVIVDRLTAQYGPPLRSDIGQIIGSSGSHVRAHWGAREGTPLVVYANEFGERLFKAWTTDTNGVDITSREPISAHAMLTAVHLAGLKTGPTTEAIAASEAAGDRHVLTADPMPAGDLCTEIRRALVRVSGTWGQKAEAEEGGDVEAAATMASVYAYALAAALRIVQEEHGAAAANDLAREVDDLLTNGDFDDLNGDVAEEVKA